MNIRRTLRSLHRDFGYLVVGITVIYTISGIALNHRSDWNPHYSMVTEELTQLPSGKTEYTKDEICELLEKFESQPVYKKHFLSRNNEIKIFIESGTVIINPEKGTAELGMLVKRPFFFQINQIHLAQTHRMWIWISDIMAIFLLFVAISGLFILKGKYGLAGRGWYLTAIGILIPLVDIFYYLT